MKKFIYVVALMLLLSMFTLSCSDSDNNVVTDPCENTNCQNGGTCENGICNCPEGYIGVNCETERAPIKISITKVVVKEFPNVIASPDIYINIYREATNDFIQVYEADTYVPDATSPGNHVFTISPPVQIYSTNTSHVLAVFDYNWPSEDDYIGSSTFLPYQANSHFPSMTTVTVGDVKADLYLEYEW